MCNIFKTAARRVKTKQILGPVGKSLVHHTGYLLLTAKLSKALCFHLFSSDSYFRPPGISKTPARKEKQQTLGPFEVCLVYTGYVLLLNIQ